MNGWMGGWTDRQTGWDRQMGWMDGFYFLFNFSTVFQSYQDDRRWRRGEGGAVMGVVDGASENERQCAMEPHLQLERFPESAGLEPRATRPVCQHLRVPNFSVYVLFFSPAFRGHAVVHFQWHPTLENKLLSISPTGSLRESQIYEKLCMVS